MKQNKISEIRNFLSGHGWAARFVRGSFWQSIGVIASKIILLLSNFFVARFLGADGFGQLVFVQNTINSSASIAGLGMSSTTTMHVSEYRQSPKDLSAVVSLSLLVASIGGMLISGVLVLFPEFISSKFLSGSESEAVFYSGLCVIFAVLVTMFAAILAGLEEFKSNAYVIVLANIINVILVIWASIVYGVRGSVYALVLGNLISFIVYICVTIIILREKSFKFDFSDAICKIVLLRDYALPAFLSGSVTVVATWYVQALYIKEGGYIAFGIFAAANQLFISLGSLNRIFSSVMLPVYISSANSGTKSLMLDKFNLAFSWTLSTSLAMLILIFSGYLPVLLGGSYQSDSWESLLGYLMLAAVIVGYKQGLIRIVMEHRLMWFSLLGNFLWSFLLLIFANYFMAEGGVGLAKAFAWAYVINTLFVCAIMEIKGCLPSYFLRSRSAVSAWFGIFVMCFSCVLDVKVFGLNILSLFSGCFVIGALYFFWKNDGGA